jgi:hypothetical protein
MKRKQLGILAGVSVVLVAALVISVALLGSAEVEEPAAAQGPVERPFGMRTHEVVVSEAPGGECPFVQTVVEGTGTASHLGKLTITRTHCFTPENNPPIHDGSWEAVAANGDRVWGSYFGSLVPTEFDDQGNPILGEITSPYTLDGGTGRFEGASGEGITVADYDLVTNEGDFLSEGWIWY